jgi:hypothetical protein
MKKSILNFLNSPDVQIFFENNVLRPLLEKVFNYLYPYLIGIACLWIIMFLCTVMILVLLMRTGI